MFNLWFYEIAFNEQMLSVLRLDMCTSIVIFQVKVSLKATFYEFFPSKWWGKQF